MNMPYFPLQPCPSRASLREAHRHLAALSKVGMPGAADELSAVDALTRLLFPRRTADSPLPGRPARAPGRRVKRLRLIDGADCVGVCTGCRGRKGWVMPSGEACIICPSCRGSGKGVVAASEVRFGLDPMARGSMKLRGQFAPQFGCSDVLRQTPRMHTRGFLGIQQIGNATDRDAEQASHWCAQPGKEFAGALPSDLSAEREADAGELLKALAEPVDGNPRRGRRLNGSRRDADNLTCGQQSRSRMCDRVPKYQAQLNKQRRASDPYWGRSEAELSAEAAAVLAKMGVVVPALPPAAPVEVDSPVIAEARRRGDLPPDDCFPQPSHSELMAMPTFGAHRGELGRVGDRVQRVVRSNGTYSAEWGHQVCFPDGSLEVYHADDLCFA